jgi:addiction module HigA family antidote
MSRKLKPVSPGEMLAEEFLKPLGMSNYRLAKEIGVPAQRIGDILARKRANITADTDLRLCGFSASRMGGGCVFRLTTTRRLRRRRWQGLWRRSSRGQNRPRTKRLHIEAAMDE